MAGGAPDAAAHLDLAIIALRDALGETAATNQPDGGLIVRASVKRPYADITKTGAQSWHPPLLIRQPIAETDPANPTMQAKYGPMPAFHP